MSTPKGEPREVSLAQTTAESLSRHRVRQDNDRLLAGPAWSDAGLVFTTALGGPLDPNNVYDRFIESCRRAGVPVIRLHDGRHTAATLALQAGAHPKLVQEMLGHASIEMTLSTRIRTSCPACTEKSPTGLRRCSRAKLVLCLMLAHHRNDQLLASFLAS